MITNASLTCYHKSFDNENKVEIWTRFNYDKVWWFNDEKIGLNKGYFDDDKVSIRIPYDQNENLDIKNFSNGDILVNGSLDVDIETQQDLVDLGYEVFNITSKANNTTGINQHIHLGGK